MKKLITNIFLVFGFVYGCLYFIGALIEVYFIFTNPKEYQHLYNINLSDSHWQFRSIENLQIWSIAYCLFYIGYALTALIALRTKVRFWIFIYFLLTTMIVVFSFRYYLLLKSSGFDHYPGFDPYIL